MSAWVLDKDHIDFLLSAGMSRSIIKSYTLRWFDRQPVPSDSSEWLVEHRRELSEATAGQVGAMLLATNRDSVNARYREDEIEEPYLYQEVRGPFDPVVVLKAVKCYEYQSCEHDEWAESEAAQFCETLKTFAIDALPGYDQANGWPIEGVQYETGIRLSNLGRK